MATVLKETPNKPETASPSAPPHTVGHSHGLSIQIKILTAFLLFTVIALCLLWVFQFVFLDQIYRSIKLRHLEMGADAIIEKIDQEDVYRSAESIAERYDFSALLIYPETGSIQKITADRPGCELFDMEESDYNRLLRIAEENQGTALLSVRPRSKGGYAIQSYADEGDSKDLHSIIYVLLFESAEGSTGALFINTVITPIDAVQETIFYVLLTVSVILLFTALALAMFMSRSIARPIIRISKGAKQLAEGDYDYRFEETGSYREAGELAATLNDASHQLAKLEKLRRELIANVSHDLRTPLTLISGYSEVMRDLPGEITPENLQTIIDESARLTSLVNDMLEISKIQSGNLTPVTEPFSLTAMLRESVSTYQTLATCKGYHFQLDASQEVTVIGDRAMLFRALNNLINNAITYTGADQTVLIRQKVDKGRVRVEVTDSGEGIAPENLADIWDRYYKVDAQHKRSAVGTGLGLSIVKSIISMHNGAYGVRSSNGYGSTFWFELECQTDAPSADLPMDGSK